MHWLLPALIEIPFGTLYVVPMSIISGSNLIENKYKLGITFLWHMQNSTEKVGSQ